MSFMAYKHQDGSVGVRNYVAVLSTVWCANEVVLRIVEQAKGTVPITHNMGCGETALTPYYPLAGDVSPWILIR
jgi:altronate dehydratase large subunit